jgi:hypothetical protein
MASGDEIEEEIEDLPEDLKKKDDLFGAKISGTVDGFVFQGEVEDISVQVMLISGEVAWGPQMIDITTKVGELIQKVADQVGKSPISIRLLRDADDLDPEASLASLDLRDKTSEITLQCWIDEMLAGAQATFEKFLIFHNIQNPNSLSSTTFQVADIPPLARSDIGAKLKEVSEAAGLDELPADVAKWLQVLLCSGKAFCDNSDGFDFDSRKFLAGMAGDGDSRGGGRIGGLVYLCIFGDNGYVLYWIIDAGGELARMNAEERVGAIYFAETWDDIWEMGSATRLTAAFWKDVMDHRWYNRVTIVQRPKRVAESLSDFFNTWMNIGCAPGGKYDR